MSDFFERVYFIVRQIPKGKVTTYGDVARAAGSPRSSRMVGWALHCNPYFGDVPCHRVVFKDGKLARGFAFGGVEMQKALLEADGVEVSDDCTVDMQKYKFTFEF